MKATAIAINPTNSSVIRAPGYSDKTLDNIRMLLRVSQLVRLRNTAQSLVTLALLQPGRDFQNPRPSMRGELYRIYH
jgi:hypothetical protein